MERFVPNSPLPGRLGIELVALGNDRAELRLPFDPANTTMGNVVHGGAIATLIDTAGMAASWADEAVPATLAGATVTLNVSYLAAAVGADLTAIATVSRRGRRLCFVAVEVRGGGDRLIATGSMVHGFG
jgi:uncharacterized protein (TIGR00369 family)